MNGLPHLLSDRVRVAFEDCHESINGVEGCIDARTWPPGSQSVAEFANLQGSVGRSGQPHNER
jgi:hypothetical protein